MTDLSLFATVPRGLESLLAGELRHLGAAHVKQVRAGVAFGGSLETAYRTCLWFRLASRILLPLASFTAGDPQQLYEAVRRCRLVVAPRGRRTRSPSTSPPPVSPGAAHSHFVAQRGEGRRRRPVPRALRATPVGRSAPSRRAPQNLYQRGEAALSIDLSGRACTGAGTAGRAQSEAPLKENLAAGSCTRAGWAEVAADGAGSPAASEATAGTEAAAHAGIPALVDPLCGSGTLLIEGAWMAADIAPSLLRDAETEPGAAPAFGFLRWRQHNADLWNALLLDARERRGVGIKRLAAAARPGVAIRGSDRDERAVKVARDFVKRAGLHGLVAIDHAQLDTVVAPAEHGLLATNAPYGERLEAADTEAVYRQLGERLREAFPGWNAVVLAGDQRQLKAIGLAPKRETDLRNGPLECVLGLLRGRRGPDRRGRATHRPRRGPLVFAQGDAAGGGDRGRRVAGRHRTDRHRFGGRAAGFDRAGRSLGGGAEYLANRLRKNQRRLARRLQREDITCYRLYDADLPEYNLVVDVYGDWVHVQEYAAPPEIDPDKAKRRLAEAVEVIGAVLEAPPQRVVLKERRRQRGPAQYERRGDQSKLLEVGEDDLTYLVDLNTYLDTGFFIDQRLTRRLVRRLAGAAAFSTSSRTPAR